MLISQLGIYNLVTSHNSVNYILASATVLQTYECSWHCVCEPVFMFISTLALACDDMTSDGESWTSAPYSCILADAVIPNRDWWPLWLGTVVIALRVAVWHRGTIGWQRHHRPFPFCFPLHLYQLSFVDFLYLLSLPFGSQSCFSSPPQSQPFLLLVYSPRPSRCTLPPPTPHHPSEPSHSS